MWLLMVYWETNWRYYAHSILFKWTMYSAYILICSRHVISNFNKAKIIFSLENFSNISVRITQLLVDPILNKQISYVKVPKIKQININKVFLLFRSSELSLILNKTIIQYSIYCFVKWIRLPNTPCIKTVYYVSAVYIKLYETFHKTV